MADPHWCWAHGAGKENRVWSLCLASPCSLASPVRNHTVLSLYSLTLNRRCDYIALVVHSDGPKILAVLCHPLGGNFPYCHVLFCKVGIIITSWGYVEVWVMRSLQAHSLDMSPTEILWNSLGCIHKWQLTLSAYDVQGTIVRVCV